jgi:hypothetical protein
VPPTPADRVQYDSDLAAAKALLEEKVWERAWVKGRGISIEQAVEYALAQTTMEVT